MTTSPDDLSSLMSARFSCRAFKPDPVDAATISAITDIAAKTPSWCNAQPWQLTITRGAKTAALRDALRDAAMTSAPAPDLPWPNGYSGIYQTRRRETGWALYDAVGVTKGDRAGSARQSMRNFDLFDAPHCAIVSSPRELGPYGALDCGGFITAFMLAAKSHGVDSIAQAAVASFAPVLHDLLGIPDDRMILCGISFGYADTDAAANGFRTTRATAADIIDWAD